MTESGTPYIETTEKLKIRTREQLNCAEAVELNFAPDKPEPIHPHARFEDWGTTLRNFSELHIPKHQSVHQTKNSEENRIHQTLIPSLPDLTITIYTDGSKLDDGHTGAGWSIYCISQGIEKLATKGSCFLADQIEVYDAELHAVHEALISLSKVNTILGKTYICITLSRQDRQFWLRIIYAE
jgi:hypothetical protein